MQVQSPQTVHVYDVVSAGGRLALVVQYVPGCSLEALLGHVHRITPANALALLTDLAAALAALRRAAVVHGDIKPANVLLTVDGRAVLTDFGVSQLVGEQWSASSPQALSPEQSRGDQAALASDFFALGLLLYRMLYGVHPFFNGSELDVRRLRAGLGAVPAIAGLGPSETAALEGLLRALLAAEPADRPGGTFELREHLRDLRCLFPAANFSDLSLHTVSQPIHDSVFASRLPRKLVRVPLWQNAQARLIDYWERGSFGARGLLIASILAPGVLLTLVLMMPGPCISIETPRINVLPDNKMLAANEDELHALLTLLFKEQSEHAVVLGSGSASDDRYTLSSAGRRNACIAQRQLALQVDCELGRCLLQLRGLRDDRSQARQLSLPQGAGVLDIQQALAQLLGELRGFLMD